MKYPTLLMACIGLCYLATPPVIANNRGTIHFYGSVVDETCSQKQKGNWLHSSCNFTSKPDNFRQQVKKGSNKLQTRSPRIKNMTVTWLPKIRKNLAMVTMHYL